jgi:hypothetical protein
LRNDLNLVFNEAVNVLESFPFTTGENFLDEKVDWPRMPLGPMLFIRGYFLASRWPRRRLLDPPAQTSRARRPPWQCAMAWRAAAATFSKLSYVSTQSHRSPHLRAHFHGTNVGRASP